MPGRGDRPLDEGYKYSVAQFLAAIPGSHAVLKVVANRVGCARSTAHAYRRRFPEVEEAFQQEREDWLDDCESILVKRVEEGEEGAARFVLSTLGRHRGWVKRQELAPTRSLEPVEVVIREVINWRGGGIPELEAGGVVPALESGGVIEAEPIIVRVDAEDRVPSTSTT